MHADDLEGVSEGLRDHVRDPRRVAPPGAPASDVVVVRSSNAACGDELELHGRVVGDAVELWFRARGCWGVVAVASCLCERLSGSRLEGLGLVDAAAVVADLGGLPRSRAHAATLFQRALSELAPRLGAAR
jgi:NifU-like protein involved in Fe-S cluster formation